MSDPNPVAFGQFGYSVSISGNLLAVGAFEKTISGGVNLAGAVYIYGWFKFSFFIF